MSEVNKTPPQPSSNEQDKSVVLVQAREYAAQGRRRPDPNHECNIYWLVVLGDEIERLQALADVQRSIERNSAYERDIERLRAALEGLHFHHKMFEPDCRHCQAALSGERSAPETSGWQSGPVPDDVFAFKWGKWWIQLPPLPGAEALTRGAQKAPEKPSAVQDELKKSKYW